MTRRADLPNWAGALLMGAVWTFALIPVAYAAGVL